MADEGESAEGEEEQLAPGDPKGLSCGMRSIRFLGGTLTFSICSFCIEESGTAHREQEGKFSSFLYSFVILIR